MPDGQQQSEIEHAKRTGQVRDVTTGQVFQKPAPPPMREVTKGGWTWEEKPVPAREIDS